MNRAQVISLEARDAVERCEGFQRWLSHWHEGCYAQDLMNEEFWAVCEAVEALRQRASSVVGKDEFEPSSF